MSRKRAASSTLPDDSQTTTNQTKSAQTKHGSSEDATIDIETLSEDQTEHRSHRINKHTVVEALMSPKKPKSQPNTSEQPPKSAHGLPGRIFSGRDGLGAYIADPASHPPSRIVSYDDDWVVIRDMYPKATVHLLLIPRNAEKSFKHPFEALADEQFRDRAIAEAEKVKRVAASELRRLLGRYSKLDRQRGEAMDKAMASGEGEGVVEEEALPPGRLWYDEVRVGVHAHPSMTHLHIHVLSRDMHSECMRHRKHYNSFNTGFFVPLDAFPLDKLDSRWHPSDRGFLKEAFICWRCKANFGNRFQAFKMHIDKEYQQWRTI